jgi:hypothetical protein
VVKDESRREVGALFNIGCLLFVVAISDSGSGINSVSGSLTVVRKVPL